MKKEYILQLQVSIDGGSYGDEGQAIPLRGPGDLTLIADALDVIRPDAVTAEIAAVHLAREFRILRGMIED